MKNLIKILPLILLISFINIGANANPLNFIKKGLEIGKKIPKIGKHVLPNRNEILMNNYGLRLKQLNDFLEKTKIREESCFILDKKINEEEARNKILEKLEIASEEKVEKKEFEEFISSDEFISSENDSKTLSPLRSVRCT